MVRIYIANEIPNGQYILKTKISLTLHIRMKEHWVTPLNSLFVMIRMTCNSWIHSSIQNHTHRGRRSNQQGLRTCFNVIPYINKKSSFNIISPKRFGSLMHYLKETKLKVLTPCEVMKMGNHQMSSWWPKALKSSILSPKLGNVPNYLFFRKC